MSNAFEFYPASGRRLGFPRKSVAAAVVTFVVFVAFNLVIYNSTGRLQKEIALARARFEQDATAVVEKSQKLLPQESEILQLEKIVERHNSALGGIRSVWTHLFNDLSGLLPENVYILAIENSKTSKGIFAAKDREFRFKLAVPGVEVANELYMKLAAAKSFSSLSFTPRGEIILDGMPALSIEVLFKFNQ